MKTTRIGWLYAVGAGLAVSSVVAAPPGGAPVEHQLGKVESYRPATGWVTVDGKDVKLAPEAAASLNEQIRARGVNPTQPFFIEYSEEPADPQQNDGKPAKRVIGTATVIPEA